MLARLASRKAKPAGSYHLVPEAVSAFMSSLDIDALHGFGHATHQKAQEKLGTTSLKELAKKSKAVLCDALGKGTGETLYKAIRGIDDKGLESDKPRRSVSCDINVSPAFVSMTYYSAHVTYSTVFGSRTTIKPNRSYTSYLKRCRGV